MLSTPNRLQCFVRPCILEGRLSIQPILSPLRLQGPKPNIYICVCVRAHSLSPSKKQLIGVYFESKTVNEASA